MVENVSGIQFVIGGDVSPLMSSLKTAKMELADTTWVSNLAGTVTMAAKTYAMATGAAAAAMVVPFYVAMNATQQYNENIVRSMALGGDEFKDRWDEITEAVTNYSTELGVNVNDTSKAIVTLTKAGWSYGDIMNEGMLDVVTKIATANQSSVDVAAETMNAAMHIWQGDIVETADQIQVAVNASTLDVEDLSYAFQYSGAAARAAGVDFDSYISMLGALSQIEAQGGESLSTTFLRLFTDDSQALNDIFNSQIVSEKGKIDLDKLMAAAGSMTMEQQAEIFDEYSIRVGKNINYFKLVAKEYADILGEVSESTGALDQAAADMATSLPALKQRILGAVMAPLLSEDVQSAMTEALTAVLELASNEDITSKIKDIFLTSATFVKAITPGLLDTVGNLLSMFVENKDAINSLANAFIKMIDLIAKIPGSLLIAGGAMLAFMKIAGGVRDTSIAAFGSGGMPGMFSSWGTGFRAGVNSYSAMRNPDTLAPSIGERLKVGLYNKYADAKTAITGQNVPYMQYQHAPIGPYNLLSYKAGPYDSLGYLADDKAALEKQSFMDIRQKYNRWDSEYYDGNAGAVKTPRLVDIIAQREGLGEEYYKQQAITEAAQDLKFRQQQYIGTETAYKKWVETYDANGDVYSSLRSSSAYPRTGYYDPELQATVVGKYSSINLTQTPSLANPNMRPQDYANATIKTPAWADAAMRSTGMRAAGMEPERLAYLKEYSEAQRNNAKAITDSAEAQKAAMNETAVAAEKLNSKATAMAMGFQNALGQIMGIAGGFAMIVSSSNPAIQALGAMIMMISSLIAMLNILNMVKYAAFEQWKLPIAIGVMAVTGALALKAIADSRAAEAKMKAATETAGMTGMTTYEEDTGATDGSTRNWVEVPDKTPVVNMAEGGLVKARPGGVRARIGEGRYDELVLPLNPSTLAANGNLPSISKNSTIINNDHSTTINNYPESPNLWYKTAARYGV